MKDMTHVFSENWQKIWVYIDCKPACRYYQSNRQELVDYSGIEPFLGFLLCLNDKRHQGSLIDYLEDTEDSISHCV